MQQLLNQFLRSIQTWIQSWGFILRNRLTHYFLYPIALSILMGMGAVALIRQGVDYLMNFIEPHLQYTAIPQGSWWSQVWEVLVDWSHYGIAFILWIIALLVFQKINKYLTLALMSPIMALISERTESIVTGKQFPWDGRQWVRDVIRGILLAMRNLLAEFMITVVFIWGIDLLITLVIPPLGVLLSPVFAVLSFVVGAYYFGFSTMDYYNERQHLSIGQSIKSIQRNKGIAIGNGTIFSILFSIPLIGVTLATITCTVAATLAMTAQPNEEK